jgi:hypothetical protein
MADKKKEEEETNVSRALTALNKARRVVEVATQKGKKTSKSQQILEEAAQALAKAEYPECLKMAKAALRAIGQAAEGEEEEEKEEEKEEAKPVEGEAEEPSEGDEKKEEGEKEYNIFLGQFQQKKAGLDKYSGIVHVGLKTDGAPAGFIPAGPKKKLKEAKGAPVVVETPMGKTKPTKVEIAATPQETPQATKEFMAKMQQAAKKPSESVVLKKVRETKDIRGILESAETKSVLELLESGAASQIFALPEQSDLHKLPHTHGIEMELQVIKKTGEWIEGSILEDIFKYIVNHAAEILKTSLDKGQVPDLIKGKVQKVWTQDINKPGHIRGLVLMMDYTLDGKPVTLELLGRDPHGVGVTWLLEGVTPPCEYLEELEWWTHEMLRLSYLSILKTQEVFAKGELKVPKDSTFNMDDADLMLVSAGLNPAQKFVTGISFGDHHHIGIKDEGLRKEVYNLYRNYLPHLIALTVNSPVQSAKVPDIKFSKNRIVSSPLSYRLSLNEGQLCSGEANTHIPHLAPENDVNFFIEATNKSDAESARLLEMFPFTKYETIEVRIFDGQLSVQDRMGMALILQALALKVSKLRKEGKSIPGVSSYTLVENRKRVIKKGGLLGLKKDKKLEENAPWFHEIYQAKLADRPEEKITRISHSIQNLFHLIKDELMEICPSGTYLDTFLVSVYGGDKKVVDAPISQAQYQLFVLDSKCKKNLANNTADTPSLIEHLAEVGRKVSSSMVYNPMVEEFGKPITPRFLNPSGIRFGFHVPGPVFSGQDCLVSLKVNNETDANIGDLKMETLVFNNKLKKVFEKWDTLGDLEPDNERFFSIPIKTVPESTYFILKSEIKQGDDVITTSSYDIVLDQVFCSVAFAGTDGGEIKTPFMMVPFVLRLKQTSNTELDVKVKTSLAKMGESDPVHEEETSLSLPPEREVLFSPEEGTIREELREFVKALNPQPLEIKSAKSDSLGAGGQFYIDVVVASEDGDVLARARSEPFTLGSE